jgi:hypothetical protein
MKQIIHYIILIRLSVVFEYQQSNDVKIFIYYGNDLARLALNNYEKQRGF